MRATIDAFSLNNRVILAEQVCFDYSATSHAISLCDMHVKYVNVVPATEVLSYFNELLADLFDLPAGR